MWIILEKDGQQRKVLPGESYGGDWTPVGVEADPNGADPARELAVEAAQLLNEIDAELGTEGRGAGDWIKFFAKPVALLLDKTDCASCDVRGTVLNAYKRLKAKHGTAKARSMVMSLVKRSFTEEPVVILRELKEAIEG